MKARALRPFSAWKPMLAAAGLAMLAAAPARAAYPERTINAIVPFTVGGTSDIIGRIIASYMSRIMGQTVLVENKPGAGGNIGISLTAQAKPDGYTVLLSSVAMTVNPALYKTTNWDPDKIQPIALPGLAYDLVTVNAKKFPTGGLQDLIDQIKKEPGKWNFASSDSGLICNLFRLNTGTQIEIVPYGGSGDAAVAAASGEADVYIGGPSVLQAQIKSGKVRALAVTGPERLAQFPDVPTNKGTTFAIDYAAYNGVYVPAGTPKEIVDKISSVVNQLVALPDVKEKFANLGSLTHQGSVEEATKFFHDDIAKWKDVVKQSNIPPLE